MILPEQRIALVIGNSGYEAVPRLRNPLGDASAVATVLRRLGFTHVDLKLDLDRRGMTDALREFSTRAMGADWAVIYYSGHGLELSGVNYLVPVDARLEKDIHIPYEVPANGGLDRRRSLPPGVWWPEP